MGLGCNDHDLKHSTCSGFHNRLTIFQGSKARKLCTKAWFNFRTLKDMKNIKVHDSVANYH